MARINRLCNRRDLLKACQADIKEGKWWMTYPNRSVYVSENIRKR